IGPDPRNFNQRVSLGRNDLLIRTFPKLMSHQVEKITVPIPFPASPEKSMLEQQRIVGILDKLEAITFSLTEGLPREIELRQKQYEYYRDLLFSFPRPETASN
ncbi:restriction endonuclease subunit S, partial [Enterobacter hormaechei]|nr:restriction endonuclease subunit S [Enterobacter hormaechei]